MKNNNYWKNYKKKYSAFWHFNPLKKVKKEYLYLGNIKSDYKALSKKIINIEKKIKISSVVNNDVKLKKAKLNNRIEAFKDWGYKKEQTQYFQIFSKEYPEIFQKYMSISGLENCTSSIIKQYPGNIIPWHYDTHITFKNFVKKNKNLSKKQVIRYMVFLTDWDWGHYFCVGNSIVHQWRAGDIITWPTHLHHCGSNSGMSPKITMNITGFINKNCLHKKKRVNF